MEGIPGIPLDLNCIPKGGVDSRIDVLRQLRYASKKNQEEVHEMGDSSIVITH